MSSVIVVWCPSCEMFARANQNAIGGDGGTLILNGRFLIPCPRCNGTATSPGGQFRLEDDTLIRVSDNLSKTQAEELKSRLAILKEQGYSITALKELVEGYAPQLLPYIQTPDQRSATSRMNWVFLGVLLWQIAHNTTCNLDVKLDINHLLDNTVKQANQEIAPAAKSLHQARRNDPCPCGSGKKFKKCCGRQKAQ